MFVLCHLFYVESCKMIYLFGTGSWDGTRKALKIGYSETQLEREIAYDLHNPLGKFLAWREGDRVLELKLHLCLMDYKEDFRDEWFFNEDKVLEIFSWSIDKIDSWLWENRGRIFLEKLSNPNTLKGKILKELMDKFSPSKPLQVDENLLNDFDL